MLKNIPHTYAVILAGGSGTRFWPMSRRNKPKQFLNVLGKRTLLGETIKRIKAMIGAKHIYIVAHAQFKRDIAKEAKAFGIPLKNILSEPQGKNTAPAIGWAASVIYRKNPQAVLAVLPSDHLILKPAKYFKVLKEACRLAQENFLVTLGIIPTRPETGYGYLKIKNVKHRGRSISLVEKFTEKPSLKTAQQFLKSRNYLWNSGMFVWKVSVILEEFRKHLPSIYQALSKTDQRSMNRIWKKLPSISVDYGILEKSKRVAAVGAEDIGWSDLGSFESLYEALGKDKNNNILRGDVIDIASRNTLVWAHKKTIATVGLSDMIVIDTEDALLICPKQNSQNVRAVVEILKRQNRSLI